MRKLLFLLLALLLATAGLFAKESIKFDRARYGVSAGDSVTIKYSLPSEGKVALRCSDGWSARVIPNGGLGGSIVLTAPDPAPKPDIMVDVIYPGGEEQFINLDILVKDPYTAATRPRVDLLPFGGLDPVNTTQEDYQKVADAGFTMITLEGGEKLDMNGDGVRDGEDMLPTIRFKLDLIKKAGLKYSLHHPQHAEVIDFLKDDPDLMMIHIFDEPGLQLIPMLRQRRDWIKSIAPNVPVHINLHPHASIRALGTDYYTDYVRKMVEGTKMDIVSYDHYPVLIDGSVMNEWYRCLEANYQVGKENNIPVWLFVASCGMDYERPARQLPTMENLRLQVYTDLAYGAPVVQYFVYRSYSPLCVAPITHDGKYTYLYDLVKDFNAEVHRRGFVFAGGTVPKVRFTHLTPYYCLPLISDDMPAEIPFVDTDKTALVSFVENGDNRYLVLVNSSCTEKFTAEVEFASMVYTIDRDGLFTEHQPGREKFVVDKGDILVIKYR
ncbi:MAG: beta-galactosidase [Bacteroidales bacterium]|nr:beta-galactosidase [Bacteroidales bacterium]